MPGAKPAYLTKATAAERNRGDGQLVADFVETFCRTTNDSFAGPAGEPLRLRSWQTTVLDHLFARRGDGRRKYRTGLIGVPRKNGKSGLGSGVGIQGLFCGPAGAEVYAAAADKDQARIVFGVAKRMVELDEELSGAAKLYRDAIEVPATGAVYRVLSSEAFTKEGLNPTLVVYDELHAAPSDELWNVMNLGSGARVDPLVLAITTAGVRTDITGQDSICYRLYQHGKRVVAGETSDPSFFFAWWEAPDGADHRLPATWRRANPAYGDLIDPEDFASQVLRIEEPEFRIKRCNQWVAGTTAWLPAGAFEGRATTRFLRDGEPVVLFFDGSWNGDSTGLVACTLDRHLEVVAAWEKPDDDRGAWRVPIQDVLQTVRDTCRRYQVLEVAADPYRWAEQIQALTDEGYPMMEYPTSSPARMVPACAAMYDAVMTGTVTHTGDPRLTRHMRNAVVRRDRLGPRIVKESSESARRIDLAVCAVGALDRAIWHANQTPVDPATQIW